MSQKTIKIIGWALTAVLGILLTMSAFMKIAQSEEALGQAALVGIDAPTYLFIGIIELISLTLFVVPRTGVLGTLLLVAYLGGAIVTHLEHDQPVTMAVSVQVLLWTAAIIRFPELRIRLLRSSNAVQGA